jgi:hypothetical protein
MKKYDPEAVDRWIDLHASEDKDIKLRTAMERSDKISAGKKRSETMKNRWQDLQYQQNVSTGLNKAKHHMQQVSSELWQDPSYRAKQAKSRSRKCQTPLGIFDSLEDATKAHNRPPCNRWIRNQIKKQVSGFRYLD